jgi:hypothetical protein
VTSPPRTARRGDRLALPAAVGASAAAAIFLVAALRDASAAAWVLARAAGLAAYVLLVALVVTGILLAHPWTRTVRRPRPEVRLTLHATLAVFTLAFTACHLVVVATDPWVEVGWAGALLPLASDYRPVPVTLGVLAFWAGLVTGATARLAGRVAGRAWWPIHRAAAAVLALAWAHGVLAGSDTAALRGFYLASGLVLALAVTRYAARSPRDRADDLARALGPPPYSTDDNLAAPGDVTAERRVAATEAPR